MRLLSCLAGAAITLSMATASAAQQSFSLPSSPVVVPTEQDVGRPISLDIDASSDAVRRTLVGEEAITFDDGAKITRYRVDETIVGTSISESGRFVAVVVLGGEKSGEVPGLLLELFEADFGLRYRVPLSWQTDDPFPGVSIDDTDGSAAVLHHAEGRIAFLSGTGVENAAHRLTSASYDIERTIMASRASSSGRMAVAVDEPVTDGVRSVAAGRVHIFTSSGQSAGGFDITPLALSSIEISSNGTRIAVGAYDVPDEIFRTTIYDSAGRELYQSDFAAEDIEFDAGGDLAMISNKRRIAIVQPSEARTLLDYRQESSGRLLDIAFSEDGNFAVALTGTAHFAHGKFLLGDMKLVEFVRGPDGDYTSESKALDETVEFAHVAVESSGVAVGLDDKLLIFRRQ